MHFKYVESFISRVHRETKLSFYEWCSLCFASIFVIAMVFSFYFKNRLKTYLIKMAFDL